MPPFPVGRPGGPGAALAGVDLESGASRQATGQDLTRASTLGGVLQSPQLGEPEPPRLSPWIRAEAFLMAPRKGPLPGCARWGQVEPSAQLRLSPLGANRLIVGPLPHAQSCTHLFE